LSVKTKKKGFVKTRQGVETIIKKYLVEGTDYINHGKGGGRFLFGVTESGLTKLFKYYMGSLPRAKRGRPLKIKRLA